MVIVSKPITAVLYLIGLYLSVSILLLLTGAEFVAVIIVVLYVGAIIILLIFVIMRLNVRIGDVYNTVISYIPLGIFLGIVFFIEVLYFIYRDLGLRESYIGSSTYTLD
jgi:NADH-quinone oxidoreductase subunit J